MAANSTPKLNGHNHPQSLPDENRENDTPSGQSGSSSGPASRFIVNRHIDYGTMNYSEGVQVCRAGENPDPYKTNILRMCPMSTKEEIPQMVGYVDWGGSEPDFAYGMELQKLLSSRSTEKLVLAHFEHLKLAVCGSGEEATEAKERIESVLATLPVREKSVDDLFVRHLIELRDAARAATSKVYKSLRLADTPTRVFFAVPEIVKLGKRNKLAELLRLAGFPPVRLIPETEAAGAWHAYRFYKQNNDGSARKLFAVGNEILVVDLGGWTCNIASYVVTGSLAGDGVRMGMKATGKTTSLPLGSEMITRKFGAYVKNYLIDRPGDTLGALGLSEEEVIQKATRDFESFKCNIGGREASRTITIKGTDAGTHFAENGQVKVVHISIDAEQVMIWIDAAFDAIIAAIDRIRAVETKVITLTGGFSLNSHLAIKLREYYESLGMSLVDAGKDYCTGEKDLAVVRGSAARFSGKVESVATPFPFSLGMGQHEYFDENDHPDVAKDSPELLYQPGRDADLLMHRWKTILPKGTLMDMSSSEPKRTWLEKYLDPSRDAIETICIYEGDGRDHEAICTENNEVRPGITPYQDIQYSIEHKIVKQMPYSRQILKKTVKNGQPFTPWKIGGHWLYLLVTVTVEDMKATISLSRMPERYNPYKKLSGKSKNISEWCPPPLEDMIPVPTITTSSLYDSRYSALVHRNEGDGLPELESRHSRHDPPVSDVATSSKRRKLR